MSYIPVTIQRQDPHTEEWTDLMKLHAIRVNKNSGGEAFSAGREQFRARLSFDFAWTKKLEALRWSTQPHRIVYRGQTLNLIDFDDYMEQHLTVRLVGETYG